MSLSTFTLSGRGLTGVPSRFHKPESLAALPARVKLGCKGLKPGSDHPTAIKLNLATANFPEEFNWADNSWALQSIARMFRNDTNGTCVPAASWHILGVQAGKDAHRLVAPSDEQLMQQYVDACGAGDQGCWLTDVINLGKFIGLPAGNEIHRIDDYGAVAYWDDRFVKACILLFGGVLIGLNLPTAWFSSDVWDVTDSPIAGGHCVGGFGWDRQGVLVASWGRQYKITWAVVSQQFRWLFQMITFYGPDWYNTDLLTPTGFSPGTLKSDLVDLGRSIIPPLTPGNDWVLAPGDQLQPGQGRRSQNGKFWFVMQPDSNLVLYGPPTPQNPNGDLWSSRTFGQPGTFAAMQPDGNLVVYSVSGPPLWHSWTFGHKGSTLAVQDDGNVVIYDPAKPVGQQAIWWTGTFGK